MVTGNSLDLRVRAQEPQQVCVCYSRVVRPTMKIAQPIAKILFENTVYRRSCIFEQMIMKENVPNFCVDCV